MLCGVLIGVVIVARRLPALPVDQGSRACGRALKDPIRTELSPPGGEEFRYAQTADIQF